MRLPRLVPALIAATLAGCGTAGFVPDRAHGFVQRDSAGHRHYVYLPSQWSAERTWPVVVYLHGGGERGDDGVRPTQVGLGAVVGRSHGSFPFIVVFPQCRASAFWTEAGMRERVLAALDDAVGELHGDPARVYLTGNSMGGYGTWVIAARNPARFAALVPIAGGVKPPPGYRLPDDSLYRNGEDAEQAVARAIGRTPVWIFHGARDWLVSPENARRMHAILQRLGGDVRYTELPGVGHNAEDSAYAMDELWTWLAARHR